VVTEGILTMAKSDRVRYVSTFRAPTEYERQLEEARRRAALAEALAQQEYQPMEGTAAPIPRAAPLVKALQGYLTAREGRKAREAAEEAKGMEADYAQRMLGRMQGGYEYDPNATPAVIPEQTELAEVTRQSQYRRAPEEVLGMASTSLGAAALKDRPVMAQRLAQMLETPAPEEFGTEPFISDEGEYVLPGKLGSAKRTGIKAPKAEVAEMTPYQREMLRLRERDINLRERMTGAGRPMSATAQRELFEADENVIATEAGIEMLDQAIKLSPTAYEGVGASQRATAATLLPDSLEPKGTKETLEFDLLLKQQVLPQLKSIFGAAPTEGERAILLELQGSSSLPKATREAVLKRARRMAAQRLQFNKEKAQKLRSGSYFTEQPAVMPPDGFELE
jgi:hypothetical protein